VAPSWQATTGAVLNLPPPIGAPEAAGCLLGLALGDALGAPFEGSPPRGPEPIDRLLAADASLRWTDDTHMMLALADALLARDLTVDPQHLGDTFAQAYRHQPWRGYGSGPPRIFAMASAGRSYLEAAASLFGGSGSLGNGAAMRCAPVVIAGWPDADRTWQLATEQALVTHSHPEGIDGAVLLSAVLRLAVATPAAAPLTLAAITADAPPLRSSALRAAWDALRTVSAAAEGTRDRQGLLELAGELGTSVTARTSVPAAIAVALHAPDDVVDTVRAAVGLGGDTDTVAAMAAAITGAHLGSGAIPPRLLERLEARERIASTATALARASQAKGP